jgi:hypothetical protein
MSENSVIQQAPTNEVSEKLTPVQPSAQIISFCEIECRVVLYKGMFCLVHCYDVNKQPLKIFSVELTPAEYNDWVDDAAMEALILSKCGLTKT